MDNLRATHEGWFCPVWAKHDVGEGLVMLPKYKLFWIYDAAVRVQQCRNFLISLIMQSDEYGGFPVTLTELKEPIDVN
jgi:hypothetical protein